MTLSNNSPFFNIFYFQIFNPSPFRNLILLTKPKGKKSAQRQINSYINPPRFCLFCFLNFFYFRVVKFPFYIYIQATLASIVMVLCQTPSSISQLKTISLETNPDGFYCFMNMPAQFAPDNIIVFLFKSSFFQLNKSIVYFLKNLL